jgi:hypothetical protein
MIDEFLSPFLSEHTDKRYHTIQSIDTACTVIKRWTPSLTEDQRKYIADNIGTKTNIMELFGLLPESYRNLALIFWNCCAPMIARFRRYMPYLNLNISDNALNRSVLDHDNYTPVNEHPVLCFLTGYMITLIFIMHFPNWHRYIDDLVDYISIYILIDNYFDDLSVSYENRKRFIGQIETLLHNPEAFLNHSDRRLCEVAISYSNFIRRHPTAKRHCMDSFKIEVTVMALQKQAHLDREVYYKIFMAKGAAFSLIIKPLIHEAETIKLVQLGIICQLFDDICDVLSDAKTGNYTLATYELSTNGNLDLLVVDLVNRIERLGMPVIQMLFSVGIIDLIEKFPSCYSERLHDLLKDHKLSSHMDDKWFFSRMLCAYVTDQ